jgi:hypothetical protein
VTVEDAPTFIGQCGRAWPHDPPPANSFLIGPMWFFNLPGAHPAWSHYLLTCIHLRPDDAHPPDIAVPGATHELRLVALNQATHPQLGQMDTWQPLQPPNAVEQFQVGSDEKAIEVTRLVAHSIVDGILPAEPTGIHGARDYWRKTIERTAEHAREGPAHPTSGGT